MRGGPLFMAGAAGVAGKLGDPGPAAESQPCHPCNPPGMGEAVVAAPRPTNLTKNEPLGAAAAAEFADPTARVHPQPGAATSHRFCSRQRGQLHWLGRRLPDPPYPPWRRVM